VGAQVVSEEFPFDDERTIIRPLPARPPERPSAPPPILPQTGKPEVVSASTNPLTRAAAALLLLTTQLNGSVKAPDMDALHRHLIEEIRGFVRKAEVAGVEPDTVRQASYVLCTVIDEVILNTPWGRASGWAQRSLLSVFHKEVSGGKRFFEMLDILMRSPSRHLHLLELMYLCLALGFEGTYRIQQGGHEKLARLREDLYRLLDRHLGSGERALSPHWKGVQIADTLTHHWPLWAIGAVCAGFLGVIYIAFLLWSNRASDPVLHELYAIHPPALKMRAVQAPPEEIRLTLTDLLAREIERGQVWVVETDRQARVTISSGSLFASGRAEVARKAIPVLNKVGRALEQVQGQILITGHTDNRPIRTARFPSNWHLSKARAQAVANVIEPFLSNPARISVEGRGDAEPVASNKSPQGRAKNRRVEILLLK